MKEIIFFRNTKPSKEEIYKDIQHFCHDHCMTCAQIPRKNLIKFRIDGEIYQVVIRRMEGIPVTWMVSCSNSIEKKSKEDDLMTATPKGTTEN